MKLSFPVVAGILVAAGLGACSSNQGPAATTTPTAAESTMAAPVPTASATKTSGPVSVKASCELFNTLHQEYAGVSAGDTEGYEDVYLKSEAAKDTSADDVRGLFAALSLIAIDRSSAAGTGGEPEQASKDALRDAVFANAGSCSAEGVTLRL
jgi:hypothetical protein